MNSVVFNTNEGDVHAVAGLVKAFLRDLPEPIFSYMIYDPMLHATSKELCSGII